MVVPKKSGSVRITVNYQDLNHISSLNQLPIPGVDQILDCLCKERVFPMFDLVSSFHQITAHKNTVPLTVFALSPASMSGSPYPRAAALRPSGSSRLLPRL